MLNPQPSQSLRPGNLNGRALALGLTLGLAGLAQAGLTPIPLDPSSFNQDPVIEAAAPKAINDFLTVTPDQGTNRNGNTWFEVGYSTNGNVGLPAHGSIVTAVSNVTHRFQMPPDYHTNNCLFVGHNNSRWTPILHPLGGTPATFTLATPAAYQALSVLNSSGNGACTIKYVVHHQAPGNDEEGTFSSVDWFASSATATAARVFDAGGCVGMNGGVNNLSANHGSSFYNDIALGDPVNPVTSIDFFWVSGSGQGTSPWGNGRTIIFALSGSTDSVNFAPITVSGYDQDVVVEADAPHTDGSAPAGVNGVGILTNGNTYCSFTMDNAQFKANWTWYERGYYSSYPNSGLPVAGSTIQSGTRPDISYTMPSTYAGNCAACLSSNITSTTITFASPTAAGSLAFLGAGGNGAINIRVEINFQGGASETNWIRSFDWFDRGSPWAWVTFGQVNPGRLAVRNTPDQFANVYVPVQQFPGTGVGPQPFSRDPRLDTVGDGVNPNLPIVRLYDMILPVTNSTTAISSINLVLTNTGSFGNTVAIFGVSGGAGAPPVITQPAGMVLDSATGNTNATTGAAVANNIRLTKGWAGTNDIVLGVSNVWGNAVNYQWKRAPRGGGFQDLFDTFNLSSFTNVTGPNIGGATSPMLVISNATLADSADYLVVASNPYGAITSFVATVMVLNTNATILSGTSAGDVGAKWSADGTSGNGQETFTCAFDQKQQKWLSTGLGSVGLDGSAVPQATVPFVGPVGYTVTPINGASIVNSILFYSANDSSGRDPRDYLLEGSNDGANWASITGGQLLGTLMLPSARDTGGTGFPFSAFTNPCVEIDFANATAYKSYRITITNNVQPIWSPLMQVSEIALVGTLIPNPPVWVRQPLANVTVFAGGSPTWGVEAGGYPAPKFQWYTNGVAVPGATGATFTLPNAQTGNSGYTISATAQNNAGTITSSSSTLAVIAAPTQSYPAAVLANSPLGYWRLDEADNAAGNNGVVAKDYTGGHNGSYSNVVLAVAGYNPVSDPDTAAQFPFGILTANSLVDGINFVDFARSAGQPGATFSVEAWVYGTEQSLDGAIVTKGYDGILNVGTGTGTEQFALDVLSAGGTAPRTFRFLVRGANGQGYQAFSSVSPIDPVLGSATWHHLVGVCDQPNGSVYLYVDGLLAAKGSIPANAGIFSQALPMTIGARKSTQAAEYDQMWTGVIDDVAVYGTALSASQALGHLAAAQRPPLFSRQPVNLHTNDNTTAVFRSAAYGAGTVTYQWYNSDGANPTTPIGGQTSSNYAFTATTALNGTVYQVVAANAYGAVTSAVVSLTVESGAPAFVFQDLPASQTVFLGHVLQLHVVPSGTAPFIYQWQRNGANLSDDYRTSGSQTDTLTIGYAGYPDSANYSVLVTGIGQTSSTVDALVVTTNSSAFFNATGNAADWSLQGTPSPAVLTSSGGVNTLQLTAGLGSTARSAFMNTKQNIGSFQAVFVYQVVSGSGGADGVTFCIQNQAVTALGGAGGALGVDGITPSAELCFNIFSSNTRGISFNTGGTHGPYTSLAPNINIGANTNAVAVELNYDGAVLTAKFTDMVTSLSYTTNFTVNLPSVLGASTAWVGFTGADGGTASTQTVSWSVRTPTQVALTFQPVGNNLVLSWPAVTGAYLQTTSSLDSAWAYDNTDTFRVVGDQATVTVPPGAGQRFFRLQVFP